MPELNEELSTEIPFDVEAEFARDLDTQMESWREALLTELLAKGPPEEELDATKLALQTSNQSSPEPAMPINVNITFPENMITLNPSDVTVNAPISIDGGDLGEAMSDALEKTGEMIVEAMADQKPAQVTVNVPEQKPPAAPKVTVENTVTTPPEPDYDIIPERDSKGLVTRYRRVPKKK